jgi:osmoprotectant transport system permease protein
VNNQLILAGAVPAAFLALFADFSLGWLERRLRTR